MKSLKFMLTALGLISLSTTALAQNLPSYVPANGLVGWWPFNGNANDESGNGNNGTLNGATLTSDRFGNANKAYSFDGVNDYVEVLNNSTLSVQNWSISAWINVSGFYTSIVNGNVSEGNIIVGKGTDFNDGFYSLSYLSLNKKARTSIGIGTLPNFVDNTTEIVTGQWIQLTGTWDGSFLRIYYNGQLEKSNPISISQGINSENLFFGTMAANSIYPYWVNGKLDDIGIWNRALTQQEITNLYNASTLTPAPCPTLPVNLQNGLVGYWPFCGNANDESGNGNNGTSVGAVLTSDRFGNSNKAYKFNGLNFTRIQVANNPNNSLNLVNDLTISSWFKADSMNDFNGTVRSIVMKSGDGVGSPNGYTYGIWAGTPISTPSIGVVNFQAQPFNNASTYPAGNSGNVTINQWYNFVVTYRKSDSLLKYYINGILIDSKALKFEIGNNNNELWIGSQPSIYTTTKTFKGALDDIAIWNRALDSTEITQLYQTQSSNSSMGNVGINVVAPQRNLHIKDVMRLEPRNAAPENPVKGDIYFDGLLNKLRVYDGTAWQNCW